MQVQGQRACSSHSWRTENLPLRSDAISRNIRWNLRVESVPKRDQRCIVGLAGMRPWLCSPAPTHLQRTIPAALSFAPQCHTKCAICKQVCLSTTVDSSDSQCLLQTSVWLPHKHCDQSVQKHWYPKLCCLGVKAMCGTLSSGKKWDFQGWRDWIKFCRDSLPVQQKDSRIVLG